MKKKSSKFSKNNRTNSSINNYRKPSQTARYQDYIPSSKESQNREEVELQYKQQYEEPLNKKNENPIIIIKEIDESGNIDHFKNDFSSNQYVPQEFIKIDPIQLQQNFEIQKNSQNHFLNKTQEKEENFFKKRRTEICDYLEKWYYRHQRKMDRKELKYYSQVLKIDYHTLKAIQQFFVVKNKNLETKKLQEFLRNKGKVRNNVVFVSQKYFKKNQKKSNRTEQNNKVKNIYECDHLIVEQKISQQSQQKIYEDISQGEIKNEKFRQNSEKLLKNNKILIKPQQISHQLQIVPEEHKKYQLNKLVEISQYSQIKIIKGDDKSNYEILSRLKPLKVYDEFYYQEIQEKIKNGQKIVLVVTKNDRGQIVQQDKIGEDQQSKKYDNYVVEDNQNITSDCIYHLVVHNEKGETVQIVTVNPVQKTLLGLETSKKRLNCGNFRKSLMLERIVNNKIRRIHTLPASSIMGNPFQIKIFEEIKDKYNKKTQIFLVDQEGKVVSKKDTHQSNGNHIYQVKTSQVRMTPNRESQVEMKVLDDSGNIISQHELISSQISQQISTKDQEKPKSKTFVKEEGNKIIRTISQQPICLGREYVRLNIVEEESPSEVRLRLETLNQNGEIKRVKEIDQSCRGLSYYTEILNEHRNSQGIVKVTVATKNNKGDILDIQQLQSQNQSVLGEKIIEDFKRKAGKKNSFVAKKSSKMSETYLQPVVVGNQYYQQIVEQVIDEMGNNTSQYVVTRTQEGQQVARERIKSSSETFRTRVKTKFEDNEEYIEIETLDANDIRLSKVELRPQYQQILGKQKTDQFQFHSQKNILTQEIANGNLIKREFSLRPYNIKGQFFQQKIDFFAGENGENQVVIRTEDEWGNIVDLREGDSNLKVEELEGQIVEHGARGITIFIYDVEGNVVGEQKVNDVSKKSSRISQIHKMSTIQYDVNEDSERHTLRPTLMANDYYYQIVDQLLDKQGQNKLRVRTVNQQDQIIQENIVGQHFQGKMYKSFIVNDFINNQKKRKITIQTVNDKGHILCQFDITPSSQKYIDEVDGKEIDQLVHDNKIVKIQEDGNLIIKNYLNPTIVAKEYYQHIVEEIVNQYGEKSLYLVTQDAFKKELNKVKLKYSFKSDNYRMVVDREVFDEKKRRVVSLVLLNDRDQVINEQQVLSQIPFDIHDQFFTENYQILDKEGKRVNTVSLRQDDKSLFKTYSLDPILIGNLYHQQTVNVLENNNGFKKGMIITSDQNGRVKAKTQINSKQLGKFYQNKITQDFIEGQSRKIILSTFNHKGEVIGETTLEIQNSEQKKIFIEEKSNSEKKIYLLNKDRIKQTILFQKQKVQQPLEEILEEDEESDGEYFGRMVEEFDFNFEQEEEDQGQKSEEINIEMSQQYPQQDILNRFMSKSLMENQKNSKGNDIKSQSLLMNLNNLTPEQKEEFMKYKQYLIETNQLNKGMKPTKEQFARFISKSMVSEKLQKKGNVSKSLIGRNLTPQEMQEFEDYKQKMTQMQSGDKIDKNQKIAQKNYEKFISKSVVKKKQKKQGKNNTQSGIGRAWSFGEDDERILDEGEIPKRLREEKLKELKIQEIQEQEIMQLKKDNQRLVQELAMVTQTGNKSLILQKSQELKKILDDYIARLQKRKLKKIQKSGKDSKLKILIQKLIREEKVKNKWVQSSLKKSSLSKVEKDFYQFCKELLPQDMNFQNNILLINLFYYFLTKKRNKVQFK